METIADRVTELRKARKWSQSELARQITKRMRQGKVHPQNIQQLEIGEIERPRYLQELADTLETTAEHLLYGEEQKGYGKIAIAEEKLIYCEPTEGLTPEQQEWLNMADQLTPEQRRSMKAAMDALAQSNITKDSAAG